MPYQQSRAISLSWVSLKRLCPIFSTDSSSKRLYPMLIIRYSRFRIRSRDWQTYLMPSFVISLSLGRLQKFEIIEVRSAKVPRDSEESPKQQPNMQGEHLELSFKFIRGNVGKICMWEPLRSPEERWGELFKEWMSAYQRSRTNFFIFDIFCKDWDK